VKPFQSQIRLHKWHVDEAQRQLAELVRLEDHLRADLAKLESDLVAEQAAAAASMEASMTYAAFAEQVVVRREKLARSIAEVSEQITHARDALRDAFAELKKFELAAEAAEERLKKRREQREQAQQDETALGMFRRKPE
jgi:flagellar protein FliJ